MRRLRTVLCTASLGCLALVTASIPSAVADAIPLTAAADRSGPSRAAPPSQTIPAPAGARRHTTRPRPKHRRHRRTKAIMPIKPLHRLATRTSTVPISYHGGRVMVAPASVYVVWYGDWSGKAAVPILTDLLRGLGGTAYAGTNTTYSDGAKARVTDDIRYGGSTTDAYSHGKRLTDAGVRALVARAVTRRELPSDEDGIYIVLTSADVHETSGFATRYCGWHTHTKLHGADLKFIFVGDPSTQAPTTCEPRTTGSPNGDAGADAMASTVTHEIDETLTDPDLNGWYDRYFNENADKCAWTYGPLYPAANGAVADVRIGDRDFLIQRNWVTGTPQGCAMRG